jgi:hypothetical protein
MHAAAAKWHSGAGDALQMTRSAPLQAEVARRGRFMASFHRDVLAPLLAAPDSPFGNVRIDLNGLGALSHCCVIDSCKLCMRCEHLQCCVCGIKYIPIRDAVGLQGGRWL